MIQFYVLYACVHLSAGKHAAESGKARCTEAEIYFAADECKRAVAASVRLKKPGKHPQSWLECHDSRADSWMPADTEDPGTQSYKAQASVSDRSELAALLAPLPPHARADLDSADLKHAFQRAYQGPGGLAFFVVGTGSRLTVFALTHLDDFQFADLAADVSSSSAGTGGKDLDMPALAENAGVEVSYHTETVQRAAPPAGGVVVQP